MPKASAIPASNACLGRRSARWEKRMYTHNNSSSDSRGCWNESRAYTQAAVLNPKIRVVTNDVTDEKPRRMQNRKTRTHMRGVTNWFSKDTKKIGTAPPQSPRL